METKHLAGGWREQHYNSETVPFVKLWWKSRGSWYFSGHAAALIVQFRGDYNQFTGDRRYYIRPFMPAIQWNTFGRPDEHTIGPYSSLEVAQAMYALIYGDK